MLLSAFIGLPVLGAAAVAFWPGSITQQQLRTLALIIASGLVALTVFLFSQFDLSDPGMQFQSSWVWVERIGLNFRLGVDGLSLSLLGLSGLLTWITIFSTNSDQSRSRLFYTLILLVNGAVAGAFLSENTLLFFLFYELELIPFYLLIAIWGGERREYAAFKFLIYTAVSGILMLIGFLTLFWLSGAASFDRLDLQAQQLPIGTQVLLLVILIVAFGIKIPLIPFHTWLPDAYGEASAPVAILLGGVLSKLGTYGLVRFCLGLFPEAWAQLSPTLAVWAGICVLGGALAAIAQKDIKKMVAYSSIGHMGYILLGCAAATHLSLVGAVAQMISHGIILAILFNLVGLVETKVGTRDLDVLNGLLNPIRGLPLVSGLLILGGMASAGIPGLASFIAEFMIFQGSYSRFPLPTILTIIGTGLTAVYFVILLNRTCFGRLDNDSAYYPVVTKAEKAPALILAVLIVFLGVQPTWLVRWSEPMTGALSTMLPELAEQIPQQVVHQDPQSEIPSELTIAQLDLSERRSLH